MWRKEVCMNLFPRLPNVFNWCGKLFAVLRHNIDTRCYNSHAFNTNITYSISKYQSRISDLNLRSSRTGRDKLVPSRKVWKNELTELCLTGQGCHKVKVMTSFLLNLIHYTPTLILGIEEKLWKYVKNQLILRNKCSNKWIRTIRSVHCRSSTEQVFCNFFVTILTSVPRLSSKFNGCYMWESHIYIFQSANFYTMN